MQLALKARATAEEALPPLREEEAIAAAVLQRLTVQRDTLDAQDRQAQQTIETLSQRIVQLTHDIDREGGLNREAGERSEERRVGKESRSRVSPEHLKKKELSH